MLQLKSEKGITLTVLAVTVMIMIILATVVIYNGINEVEKSKENKLLSEVQIVNQAVYEAYINYTKTKNASYIVGQAVEEDKVKQLKSEIGAITITIPTTYEDIVKTYYRLTPVELEKIGIYDSKDTYIVNYLTGEVINETQKTTKSGKTLYTYSKNSFTNSDVTSF